MSSSVSFLAVVHCLRTLSLVAVDLIRLVALAARPRAALVAENLFLRKQLVLFQERKVRPRRADAATRWMMAALSQWFAWRDALVNVQADTLLRWRRQGFRLFWRWKSNTAGRPRLPNNLQALIREMAAEKYHVGTGTHRQRAATETGNPGFPPGTVAKYLRRGGTVRTPDCGPQKFLPSPGTSGFARTPVSNVPV
jgi:putative transposase